MSNRTRLTLLSLFLFAVALGAAGCDRPALAEKAKTYEHVELGPYTISALVAETSVSCTATCSNGGATPLSCSASGSGAVCEQAKDGRSATCEDDDGTMVCDCNATEPSCSSGAV